MATQSGDRSAFFPAIEKKYGQPISYWFAQLKDLSEDKYPAQIAYLREEHGFSQAHANAVVMSHRGSSTSKRFTSLSGYLEPHDAQKKKTVKTIFKVIQSQYPEMKVVIAWNHPMLKLGDEYILGVSVLKNHILLGPWGDGIIAKFAPKLTEYKVNKKTIQVPSDWDVDAKLLIAIAKARVSQL
jgi:uncharacterized protein YdhG (YjbR/CyaY superfamily)